jgi:chromosome segregation ATPase
MYQEAVEELSTKEEVHESLKRTVIDLGEKADHYKSIVDANTADWERRGQQADINAVSLQMELSKLKSAWMHDLESLSQVRLERDAMHTQYNLLDQKYNKISSENKALKSKVEELKLESRANFEASKIGVLPDKNIKSATGSITRMEVEYFREIDALKKTYDQEMEKLAEELDWYKAKLETERQWSHSLELSNKHLNEQLEELRRQ